MVQANTGASVFSEVRGQATSEDIDKEWSRSLEVLPGTPIHLAVSASDFKKGDAVVSCEIIIDGKSVDRRESSGNAAVASCVG